MKNTKIEKAVINDLNNEIKLSVINKYDSFEIAWADSNKIIKKVNQALLTAY